MRRFGRRYGRKRRFSRRRGRRLTRKVRKLGKAIRRIRRGIETKYADTFLNNYEITTTGNVFNLTGLISSSGVGTTQRIGSKISITSMDIKGFITPFQNDPFPAAFDTYCLNMCVFTVRDAPSTNPVLGDLYDINEAPGLSYHTFTFRNWVNRKKFKTLWFKQIVGSNESIQANKGTTNFITLHKRLRFRKTLNVIYNFASSTVINYPLYFMAWSNQLADSAGGTPPSMNVGFRIKYQDT